MSGTEKELDDEEKAIAQFKIKKLIERLQNARG